MNSSIDVSERRYRYTGKERDEETGLGYHGARYYACWLGRWTASDPIGLGDGVNRYAYVSGRALNLSDPSGHAGKDRLQAARDAQASALRDLEAALTALGNVDDYDSISGQAAIFDVRMATEALDAETANLRRETTAARRARDVSGATSADLGAQNDDVNSESERSYENGASLWNPGRQMATRKEHSHLVELVREVGLLPRSKHGKTPPHEHVFKENLADSPYTSMSERRGGAPGFEGTAMKYDIEHAKSQGAEYISHDELNRIMDEHAAKGPNEAARVEMWRAGQRGEMAEMESLFKGEVKPSAIESPALRNAKIGARGVTFLGVVLTTKRIVGASEDERPRVVAEESAGWAGGIAGSKAGAWAGAELGGPWGALLGGLVGGFIGAASSSSYMESLLDVLETELPADVKGAADQPLHLRRLSG